MSKPYILLIENISHAGEIHQKYLDGNRANVIIWEGAGVGKGQFTE